MVWTRNTARSTQRFGESRGPCHTVVFAQAPGQPRRHGPAQERPRRQCKPRSGEAHTHRDVARERLRTLDVFGVGRQRTMNVWADGLCLQIIETYTSPFRVRAGGPQDEPVAAPQDAGRDTERIRTYAPSSQEHAPCGPRTRRLLVHENLLRRGGSGPHASGVQFVVLDPARREDGVLRFALWSGYIVVWNTVPKILPRARSKRLGWSAIDASGRLGGDAMRIAHTRRRYGGVDAPTSEAAARRRFPDSGRLPRPH